MRFLSLSVWVALALWVAAHPGEDHEKEAAEMRRWIEQTPTLQERCGAHLEARGHAKRSVDRRRSLYEKTREARGLTSGGNAHLFFISSLSALSSQPWYLTVYISGFKKTKRDLTSVLATDHNRTLDFPNATFASNPDSFFEDYTSCAAWPEFYLAEGPYCEFLFFVSMYFQEQ